MPTPFLVTDRALLANLLTAEGVFLPPHGILNGLSDEQAHARPDGLPHSIAEIVAHVTYWQEWFNACASTGFSGIPEHAVEGWPRLDAAAGGWDAIRRRCLNAVEEAKTIAATAPALDEPLVPASVDMPLLARESRGSGIVHAAMHNAHHYGQIITIRQLMGLWPPPEGSMTW